MNKTLLIVIIVVAALALGIGGAFAVSRVLLPPLEKDTYTGEWPDQTNWYGRMGGRGWSDEWRGRMPGGNMPYQGMTPFQGMMPWGYDDSAVTAERITIEDAFAQAEAYAAQIDDNLQIHEVMEFSRNFYAIVIETDSGKGAMELLIDPYTGRVTPEIGPNMMWNAKYSHMRWQSGGVDNALSLSEAAAAAQQVLDELVPGAVLEEHGIDFYGYYSFDYSVDGEIAGMLSVNGTDGRVWLHTWHGEFIGEKEIE